MFFTKPDLDFSNGYVEPKPADPNDVTSLMDIGKSAYDTSKATNEVMSGHNNLGKIYDDHNAKVKALTGAELGNPETGEISAFDFDTRRRIDEDWKSYQADGGTLGHGWFLRQWREKDYRRQLEELAAKHPEKRNDLLPESSFQSLAASAARSAEERDIAAWEKSGKGVLDWAAWMGGTLAAGATDPVNLVTAPIGFGAGTGVKGLLVAGLKAGASNAAVEAGIQPFVQDYRNQVGLQSGLGPAALAIGSAAAFGAGLDIGVRGTFRGLAHGFGYRPVVQDGVVVAWRKEAPEAPVGEVKALPPPQDIPHDTMMKAADGDLDALRRVYQDDAMTDPVIRRMLEQAEIDERLSGKPTEAVDTTAHVAALEQTARALADESEPLPVRIATTEPVEGVAGKLDAEVAELRAKAEAEPTNAELATRLADANAQIRAIDGFGSDPVRDAALLRNGTPLTTDMNFAHAGVQRARALAALSEEAFAMVRRGDAAPELGEMVANFVAMPEHQAPILGDLVKMRPTSPEDARAGIAELLRSPEYTPAAPVDMRRLDDPYGADAKRQVQQLERELSEELAAGGRPTPAEIMATPEGQAAAIARADDVRAVLAEMSGMVPPDVRVRVFSRIDDLPPRLSAEVRTANAQAFAGAMKAFQEAKSLDAKMAARQTMDAAARGEGIEGIADDAVIWIASYAMDPAGRMAHEVVHVLRTLGRLSPDEVKLLATTARDLGVWSKAREDLYRAEYTKRGGDIERLLEEEAAAHIVEAYVRGDVTLPEPEPQVRSLVERIKAFFAQIRAALSGRGFREATVENRSPAQDVLDALLSGEVAKREQRAEWMRQNAPQFAMADASTGRAMRSDIDGLGFYSAALRAARAWPQTKGTPEQALMWLKKSGVKEGEIETTGLAKVIEGQKAVTRDEIVAHLEKSRVVLNEVKYSRDANFDGELQRRMAEWREQQLSLGRFDEVSSRRSNFWDSERSIDDAVEFLKGEGVPLDRDAADDAINLFEQAGVKVTAGRIGIWDEVNGQFFIVEAPNGRALVLSEFDSNPQVAASKTQAIDDLNTEAGRNARDLLFNEREVEEELRQTIDVDDPTKWSSYSLDPGNPSYRETVLHLPGNRKPTGQPLDLSDLEGGARREWEPEATPDFRSGHFPEPNITGHMMTSMVRDAEGRPVYLIDQIQSDWGQKLRDGGVRDEKKIAELRAQLKALQGQWSDLIEDVHTRAKDRGGIPKAEIPEMLRSMFRRGIPDEFAERLGQIEPEMTRVEAEIRTAESAVSGHPLVNTTDQWVNTTLRRALRQAAEADAEYIAIPSGKTVESYNPQGDSAGNAVFYDQIVPKNLKNILKKLDRAAAEPRRVDQLDTPTQGMKGDGFTVFEITPEVKRKITEDGQPLFAFTGYHGTNALFDEVDLDFVNAGAKSQKYGFGFYASSRKQVGANWAHTITRNNSGSPQLYTVTLDAEPYQIMRWETRLKEQPETIRRAVEAVAAEHRLSVDADSTGESVYRALAQKKGERNASMILRDAGIRGNVQSNTTARNGTFDNYVMFDEADVRVETREAAPGPQQARPAPQDMADDIRSTFADVLNQVQQIDLTTALREPGAVMEIASRNPEIVATLTDRVQALTQRYGVDAPEPEAMTGLVNRIVADVAGGGDVAASVMKEVQPLMTRTEVSSATTPAVQPVTLPDGAEVKGAPFLMYAIKTDEKTGKRYIQAFHGTPHDFDRFRLDKIGSGEGAQVYGRGLYFAESEDIARWYRDSVADKHEDRNYTYDRTNWRDVLRVEIRSAGGDRQKAIKALEDEWVKWGYANPQNSLQRYRAEAMGEAISRLKNPNFDMSKFAPPPRRLYEVRIDVDPDQAILDWDAPLSEQSSAVRALAQRYGADLNMRGGDFHARISKSGEDATRVLVDAGISGVRYLDASSRRRGNGTRNFVVFDDSLIKIVSKDGVPVGDGPLYAMRDDRGRIKRGAAERAQTLAADLAEIEADIKAGSIDDRAALQQKRASLLNAKSEEVALNEFRAHRNNRGEQDSVHAFLRMHETKGRGGFAGADLWSEKTTIANEALRMMSTFVWEARKGAITGDKRRTGKYVGSTSLKVRMDNMMREAAGETTGDEVAKKMAKGWLDGAEWLRQQFNAFGGDIGKLKGWIAPQYHDAQALLTAGRDAWVKYMMADGMLDRDRMLDRAGNRLGDDDLRSLLSDIWVTVTTGGANTREVTGRAGKGALYKRHAEHRVLHFKNADAYLKYTRDFGGGDLYAMMVGHVQTMARDIAALKRFGANPDLVRARLIEHLRKEALEARSSRSVYDDLADLVADLKTQAAGLKGPLDDAMRKIADIHTELDTLQGKKRHAARRLELQKSLGDAHAEMRDAISKGPMTPEKIDLLQRIVKLTDEMAEIAEDFPVMSRDPVTRTNRIIKRADEMWKLYTGHTNTPVDGALASGMVGIRNVISSSTLAFAPISALTDQATGLAARSFVGMPVVSQLASFVKGFTKTDRQAALQFSLGLDQVDAAFAQQSRFAGWINTRSLTGYLADRGHAFSFLSPMTQAAKVGFGMDFMAWMAKLAKAHTFEALEPWTRDMLLRHGFTADDWAKLRTVTPETHRGVPLLSFPAIASQVGEDIAEKYQRVLLRERSMAVLEPTMQGRAVWVSDNQAGTIIGEMLRSTAMLKSFPTSYAMLILGRFYDELLAGNLGRRNTLAAAGAIFIVGTLLGALVRQSKSLTQGRDAEDMTEPEFWAKSFMQSGGAGIFGDFIASATSRNGAGFEQTLAGPVAGRVKNIWNLTGGNVLQYAQDEKTNFGREAVTFARQNTPLLPWYVRSVYERAILDQIQKQVDPDVHKSMQSRVRLMKKLNGTDFYYPPGAIFPTRAPNIERAFGAN